MPEVPHKEDDKGWADKPGFQRAFRIGLLIAGGIAALLGFAPGAQKAHPHFAAETVPIFFAAWGFGAFMFIVIVGQHLRKLVGRKKGYYDERE
ncbi:MAG: hypothetical protein ACFB00_13015 [Parvularculaceae bacterium]